MSTLNELSEKLNISRNNLTKVSNKLARLGYVDTVKGRSGGLQIREKTGKVSVGEIVKQTEENFNMAECFVGGKINCTLAKGCILKLCLHKALEAFVNSLNEYTLDDIT